MADVVVESYLLVGGGFVRVLDVDVLPGDGRYIEGAIELVIDGTAILDTTLWDDVDVLWAYIVNMMEELETGDSAETYFPDQPLKLKCERVRWRGMLKVSLTWASTTRTAMVPEDEFRSALCDQATTFFEKMIELAPVNEQGYCYCLTRIAEIRRSGPFR
ncbi:hypothetical protein [Herbidospora sp. RD11066]